MIVRPPGLPKARRQLLRHLEDPQAPIRANTGEHNQPGLDALASHVRAAELYWVSPEMAALAVSAGGQLAAARWATADRPAPCGLLWWDGGVGTVDYKGAPMPVDGMAWGPSGGGCSVSLLCDRRRLVDALAATGRELAVEGVPPLVPMWAASLPVTSEPVSMADLPNEAPTTVMAALAAAWLLMQQPQLVDRIRERADGPTRRAHARAGLPDPEVTIVDLRRQYVPQDQDPSADGDSPSRRYRHRWVVSGHWRSQPHGPDRALRRQQWIPAYVKGPDGAPLLATERVNVWRR